MESNKKNPKRLEKHRKQDAKGNYDIDGVSYDGEQIIVSGSKPKKNLNDEPGKAEDSAKD